MADGLTMEDVQTEAAAKQRAFESNRAEASTSGRASVTGTSLSQHPPLHSTEEMPPCQYTLTDRHAPAHKRTCCSRDLRLKRKSIASC